MPPIMFEPQSLDSTVSRILANQEAGAKATAEFREEIRDSFKRGAARMAEQDKVLEAIRDQATRTNGRVTRLEDADIGRRLIALESAEIAAKTETARQKGMLFVIGGVATFMGSVASALGAWWLAKH